MAPPSGSKMPKMAEGEGNPEMATPFSFQCDPDAPPAVTG